MAAIVISEGDKRILSRRLRDARMRMVYKNPFLGNLILHLNFTLGKCGTAATDMRRIIFDPEFVMKISGGELDFVLKHEIMHCVLQHCIRGKEKHQHFFNIACDIVVNSNIMHSMGISSFSVAGEEAMHLTPEKNEGYLYSAEEVYEMLMLKYETLIRDVDDVLEEIRNDYGVGFDSHEIWGIVPLRDSLSDEWKMHLKDAAKAYGEKGDCPSSARKLLDELIGELS